MKVVVTGGAGFIGANLTARLLETGAADEVVVVDDLSTGDPGNLDGCGAELLEGSILDRHLLDKAVHDANAVVHLAAVPSVPRSVADPLASHHANATGTLEVMEAVRRADGPYVVVASSSSVYGANRELPKRESMRAAPLSPYAVSKLATEAYALSHAYCYDLQVLAFRFFNVFGPLQPAGHAYAAVIPSFISSALDDRALTVYGDGEQTRDFTFVGSVCDVIADAVARRVTSPEPVNLAFGSRTSLTSLISLLEEALGHPVTTEYLDPRAGDVRDSQADSSRLKALFPNCAPMPLAEGLRATIDWFATGQHLGKQ
jgi:UDP-glucose 4-epimerase